MQDGGRTAARSKRSWNRRCERMLSSVIFFFFSSRRRHTRFKCHWSSDVCSSDLRLCVFLRVFAGSYHAHRSYILVAWKRQPHNGPRQLKPTPDWKSSPGHFRERPFPRSEERRVGKEGRSRWSPYH